jgi:WD40 repeat protein
MKSKDAMLSINIQAKQSEALISYKKQSHEYLTREYSFRLKENFPALGIRYLHYNAKDQSLLISNTSNGRVHILNLSTGNFRWFMNHRTTVRKIRVFNNEIFTSSWDGSVCISNYSTLIKKLILTEGTMGRCPFINISPDGKFLYSFSYDSDVSPIGAFNAIRKWSLKTGKLLKVMQASGYQRSTCRSGSIIILRNRLYVCSDNGYFRIFDSRTGKMIKSFNIECDFRMMTSIVKYNYILVPDWNGFIHFFNLIKNNFDFKLKCHNTDIMCIRVHPNNPEIIITSSADGVIRFWEMPGFDLLHSIEVNHQQLWSMVFVNNRLVISTTDGEIRIYNIADLFDIRLAGRIVLSDHSYVVQACDSKMFYTNNIFSLEVFRAIDDAKITGKESEYLLGQSNSLMVLRELFGIEDWMNGLLSGKVNYIPQLKESFG